MVPTPKHYAIHTLTNNKPDIVIINISSNNTRKDKPISIANEIIKIVTLCKSYGVNEILVSGVTPRHGCQTRINELNTILEIKQDEFNYCFDYNYMKLNESKCKLLISGNKEEVIIATVGSAKMIESHKVTLLGCHIDR